MFLCCCSSGWSSTWCCVLICIMRESFSMLSCFICGDGGLLLSVLGLLLVIAPLDSGGTTPFCHNFVLHVSHPLPLAIAPLCPHRLPPFLCPPLLLVRSLARTVYGDHKRYLDVYLNPYKVRLKGGMAGKTAVVRGYRVYSMEVWTACLTSQAMIFQRLTRNKPVRKRERRDFIHNLHRPPLFSPYFAFSPSLAIPRRTGIGWGALGNNRATTSRETGATEIPTAFTGSLDGLTTSSTCQATASARRRQAAAVVVGSTCFHTTSSQQVE